MAREPLDRLLDRCVWEGECLVWQGSGPRGYGTFWDGTRKSYVHRYVYEQTVGPIPPGFEIDHVAARGCTNTKCVNPAHLQPVDHAENRRRGRLTMCRRGLHDLTDPVNQRWDENGNRRGCKRCWLDRVNERYAARKET